MRLALTIMLLIASAASAQWAPFHFHLDADRTLDDAQPPVARLTSNVVIDILPGAHPDTLWLATGSGVSRMAVLGNSARDIRFDTYSEAQGLGKGGVSGLLVTDSIIWAAFAFDTSVGISGAGGGLAYSRDRGASWRWLPQPRDRRYDVDENGYDRVLGYWPTTTNVDNITYDIALSDSFVWIVSKGGGLRRHAFAENYTDYDDTSGWKLICPDSLPFHPASETNLNHRTFSVLYAEGALYVGTAGGINKTTDNGRTWRRITTTNGLSGHFVTAMAFQQATRTIWAATWATSPGQTYAVSKSTDGGLSWTRHLTEDQVYQATGMRNTPRAHSFGFDGEIVYVCDDLGLWKSADGGRTWDIFAEIRDRDTGRKMYEPQIYAALSANGRLWTGGVDGLAMSSNGGVDWSLIQTAHPLSLPPRSVDTYAYPVPWSPQRFGPIKLRYVTTGGMVKVSIYDFALSKVVELPAISRAPGEQYEVWDGRKDGKIVANGTYFYKIEKPGGEVWGKLVVLD